MVRALSLLALVALLASAPALASDGKGTGSGSADDVEETEVKPVAAPTAPAAKGGAEVAPRLAPTQLVGRLHPIFVHLPIGWLTLLVLLELAALVRRRDEGDRFRLALLVLALASCLPAVVSGLLRADEVTSLARDSVGLVTLHRNLMFAVSGATALALALRLGLGRPRLAGAARALYLVVLLAAAALLVYGAHLGGKLVFGERYLPF